MSQSGCYFRTRAAFSDDGAQWSKSLQLPVGQHLGAQAVWSPVLFSNQASCNARPAPDATILESHFLRRAINSVVDGDKASATACSRPPGPATACPNPGGARGPALGPGIVDPACRG